MTQLYPKRTLRLKRESYEHTSFLVSSIPLNPSLFYSLNDFKGSVRVKYEVGRDISS